MILYPQLIMNALATVTYAGTKKNLVESEMVADQPTVARQKNGSWKVSVVLEFPRETDPFLKSTVKSAEAAIKYHCTQAAEAAGEQLEAIEVEVKTEFKSKPRPKGDELLPGVKNIIAVSSGKGGVGKSTVSANLAIALARLGYKVGLLDCDIFGPSMPKMFLVSPETATLWRGGMATSALKQLIADADWGELDYFILDTPPGTSDIHLTLLQTLAITGAVIVSTPQQVALADARKGIDMYRNEKVNVPILGLIENMAWFTPAELPENRYYIFGKEGCKQLAEEMQVPLLAQIPLVQSICDSGDKGEPAALSSETATGLAFINLAQSVVTVVNKRNREQPKTKIVGVKE